MLRMDINLMQGWILKNSHRIRHSKRPQTIEVPKAKKARQSKWQVFLKQFGESSGKCCTLSVM